MLSIISVYQIFQSYNSYFKIARGSPSYLFKTMVKSGDNVAVHYKGTLTDGTVFDSSEGREPLEFQVGSGMVIAGFDSGVTDMTVGEKKTVHIPVEDAYGPASEEMIFTFNRLDIPDDIPLEVGGTLNMHNGQESMPVIVREVSATSVVLDGNHPLAGQALIFEIELVSIN